MRHFSLPELDLLTTTARLFQHPIDAAWIGTLGHDIESAERLDAFVARFGRRQDTLGDKLVPELRRQLLETPGAALDNLNRMEKLGLLSSMLDWAEIWPRTRRHGVSKAAIQADFAPASGPL